jgi:hypothetical protein
MKLFSKPAVFATAAMTLLWIAGAGWTSRAAGQARPAAPAAAKGKTAGEAFQNVKTTALAALTVDDFLGTMGVISADLGFDCADCHPGAGSDKVNWVIDTPRKVMARKMVDMVALINRTNFNGAQRVTCFTCHHGHDIPTTTIGLDTLYSPPLEEKYDVVTPGEGVPTATAILDKYIQAVGGAQKLAGLKSFIATGTSLGYEGLGGGGSFQIVAEAPNRRAVIIEFKDHPERGDSARIFDGKAGWIKSPRGLLGQYEAVGNELDGQRLDAQLSFPGQIKSVLTGWRSGNPDSINGEEVDVVQGNGPRGMIATLYFDKKTSFLVREVRYSASPIGRVPTQADFADYREVNGIKFPFQYTFSWLDGRDAFKLTDVKVNVPIDAAKFVLPAAK